MGRGCLYFLLLVSFGSFKLARAYMYALCVSGAVNKQGFVWKFFMRYIKKLIRSFIHSKKSVTVILSRHRIFICVVLVL